jgi:cytochrome c5
MSQHHSDEAHDRHFFDTFMLVLGALFGLTVIIYFTANALAESNLDIQNIEETKAQAELQARLAPVGRVATAGQPAAEPAAPVMVAMAPAAKAAAPAKIDGAKVYQTACFACHGTGAAGAPKMGDKAAWAARIKQGNDVLRKHALEGYTGKAGVMPAKGGRMDLPDADIVAALEHMVAQSK